MRTPHLRTDLSAREVATAVREAADLIEAQRKEIDALRDGWNKEREQTLKLEAQIRELKEAQARKMNDENTAYGRLLESWHLEHSARIQAEKAHRQTQGNYDNLLADWNRSQERIKTLTQDRDTAEAEAVSRGWKP